MKWSIADIQQYADIEVGRVNSQLQDIQVRVSAIDEQQQQTSEYDPEVSIIMSKDPMTAGENILQIVANIIHEGLGHSESYVAPSMEPAGARVPPPTDNPCQCPTLRLRYLEIGIAVQAETGQHT